MRNVVIAALLVFAASQAWAEELTEEHCFLIRDSKKQAECYAKIEKPNPGLFADDRVKIKPQQPDPKPK